MPQSLSGNLFTDQRDRQAIVDQLFARPGGARPRQLPRAMKRGHNPTAAIILARLFEAAEQMMPLENLVQ